MKAKLLRKVRKNIHIYKRNGDYYVDTGNIVSSPMNHIKTAQNYYAEHVVNDAKDIFGFKPKKKIR